MHLMEVGVLHLVRPNVQMSKHMISKSSPQNVVIEGGLLPWSTN